MEYVNLQTGFALMGFGEYREMSRIKQLCAAKWKPIAFAGELTGMKEIQARHWACPVYSGWMDYHHTWQAYQHTGSLQRRPLGKATALEAIQTAVEILARKCGIEMHYVLVVKM